MASLQLPDLEGTAKAMGNSFWAMPSAQRMGEAFHPASQENADREKAA